MRKFFLFSVVVLCLISLQVSAQTWSLLTRLTWNNGLSFSPCIAVDSNSRIHVAWYDSTSGDEEIYYKRSTDGGSTWSGLVRITWMSGWASPPHIAADTGSGIHLVWADHSPGNYEIFYKRSTDSGASWSGLTRMTWNSGGSSSPSVAADSGNGIHMVWGDSTPGNEEIFYKRSTNSGVSWMGNIRLTWNSDQSTSPHLAVDLGNIIHVVWSNNTSTNFEIFYKRSTDVGATWSGLSRLTWNAGNSLNPIIAADSSGGIHVVWVDYSPGNEEIFYKRSTDGGGSWSGPKRMTWNAGESSFPSIEADAGTGVYIVWYDDPTLNREVYLRESTDSGVTWSGLTRLTWNNGKSMMPDLAAVPSTSDLHIVWHDDSSGNFEIYYRNRK